MNIKGIKTVFRSLKYKNYRLFFAGQSFSLVGTWIQAIATPWLVYRLTGSVFMLGVVGFASQIPTFLFAPFAGVLTDRWNRYHILIIAQTLCMVQALVLAILFFTGTINIWYIIGMGMFLGVVNAFDMPARQSFVIDMIENREDLGNAIALNSSMVNSARLIGPSIAGVLIAATNEGVCFLLNGLSYIFVVVSLLMMKISSDKIKKKDTPIWQEFKEGCAYVFGFAPVRDIILMLGFVSLIAMPYTVLMPVFAKEILHGSSRTFGFLMGASGIGALTGALYLASRKKVLMLGKIIPLSTAVFGCGLIAISFSRMFWLSLVLMLVIGLGMIMQMASSNTILQTIVDDDKRGRMMSFYAMAFIGATPFGSLLAGKLASKIGAPYTLLFSGVLCVISAIVFAFRVPKLKKIVCPIYVRMGVIPDS